MAEGASSRADAGGGVIGLWSRRRLWLALAAALGAGACAPRLEEEALVPPEVGLRDLRLERPGVFEQELLVRLRLVNRAAAPLEVRGLRFRLSVNGEPLGTGVSERRLRIPPLAARELEGRLFVPTAALLDRLLRLAEVGGVRYRLEGEVLVRRRGGLRPLPFASEAELVPLRPARGNGRRTPGD